MSAFKAFFLAAVVPRLLFTAFSASGSGFGVALALSAGIAVAAVPVAFRVQELRPAE